MTDAELRGELRYGESLSQYTSWRVGGPAEIFYAPADIADLQTFLNKYATNQSVFWLGLGSNTLVRDGGINGIVIATQKFLNKITVIDAQHLRAEAGVSCASFARHAARMSLKGIEFLAGVPGTIGGALTMNAGCHGGETWPHVSEVELINKQGELVKLAASEFHYAYRHVDLPKDHWFTAGIFKLEQGDKENSLQIIRDLLARRAATQPTNEPSGGSTFRNPPGDYAARLIEACGLKSYRIGGAMVSDKHANFIVNVGNCCAADIEQLIFEVQKRVFEEQGVHLEPEVRIVGQR